MAQADTNRWRERLIEEPLLTALVLSLAFHLLLFGGFELAARLGWLQHLQLPAWLKAASPTMLTPQARLLRDQQQAREIPLVFVDVDPSQAAKDAPKDPKYYSAFNSRAANPDVQIESNVPKVDGKQDKVIKPTDNFNPKAFPLQPAPRAETSQEEIKPQPDSPFKSGDLVKAKASDSPVVGEQPEQKARPRTIQEALARPENRALLGEKMKQEGGVPNRGQVAFDAKGTPFGLYDRNFIDAVSRRWYDLIDQNKQIGARTGKVVLDFRLNYNGRITDMKLAEQDVGDFLAMLCERAVLDPSPFDQWPSDMRRLNGGDYREVRFTFYYQ